MFTFVMMTYNQEEYVIQHLESIKYQMENFGKKIPVDLIVSDDASTDQSIYLTKEWVNQHSYLFREIKFLIASKNQGIVKNYLKGTAAIRTPYYNIVGADDLYYKNNIFETIQLLGRDEIIFTPLLGYNENGVNVHWDITNLLSLTTKKQVKSFLKHSYPFNTSGTFYKTALVQNEDLRHYISKYTMIDDLPSIYYLFHIKEHLDYSIYYKPFVIYRDSVGVSKSEFNEKNVQFEREEQKIKEDLGMVSVNKGLNFPYLRVAFAYKYLWLQANLHPTKRSILKKIKKEKNDALLYLDLLERRADEFLETIRVAEAF